MSYSISTLLTRNLQDVFAETTPRVGARPSTRCGTKMVCSTIPTKVSTVAATRSIASRARSGLHTLTLNISQLPSPRWSMSIDEIRRFRSLTCR